MNAKLVEARKKAGFTQGRLSAKVGVNRSTYAHYERGRAPSLDMALRISRELGVSVEDVFALNVLNKHNDQSTILAAGSE